MTYSSYSNYLEYKNHKKKACACNNIFSSYERYDRTLNCNRAWWTNDGLKKRIANSPCKALAPTLTHVRFSDNNDDDSAPGPKSSIEFCCKS